MIIARGIPASQEHRLVSRPAHLARLGQLKGEGRLVLVDPHPAIDNNNLGATGFTDSLIVAEFDSLAAAQSQAEADPHQVAKVYAEVMAKPSRKVLP